ncbi:hypothetical protein FRACA_740019 [Frankia canadensis]|uniref:Uncharacterized protein n=1 Tax=Frankia canadensis TaxID=1836972 RepID=A0A2I2L0X3_9ACTN|nr:hypothetical protein FRACA_740019 [Frankia canadensis]SOU58854.1 hypothetical protein FRACA_740019 [Frankia canadensis]
MSGGPAPGRAARAFPGFGNFVSEPGTSRRCRSSDHSDGPRAVAGLGRPPRPAVTRPLPARAEAGPQFRARRRLPPGAVGPESLFGGRCGA